MDIERLSDGTRGLSAAPDLLARYVFLLTCSALGIENMVKALVIESSNAMRSLLHRILSMRGFEVLETESSERAMGVLESMGMTDLVLVDWVPSEIDGLEFITRLRNETENHPMVIMLAAVEPGIRKLRRALLAGADDYLIKPFTSLQIDEKLAQAGFFWRM